MKKVLAFIFLWLIMLQQFASATQPNVILFLVDDMGWMDCEPYGSKYYETPQMSRLATESMRFTDAYALPLCSPTRASILTGQYSARHGITSASGHQPPQPADFDFLPETAPAKQPLIMPISKNYLDPVTHYTLAEALQDAGYHTAHIGKWHLGLTEPYWPERHGFEVAFHSQPSPGPPGEYFSPYGVYPAGTPRSVAPGKRFFLGTITDGPDGEYITDRVTDEALKFIDANKAEPFFLNLWHFGVHGPWGHKPDYTREFSDKTDPTGRQGNPIMASMLRSIDESLGRILDRLDQLQLTDNTLFIFYSDNGGNVHSNVPDSAKTERAENSKSALLADWRKWAGNLPPTSNAPLREGKGRIYEGGQRVPLLVRWPGKVAAGSTSSAVVGPIDLYPTILEAASLEQNPDQVVDGESLLPVLTGTGALQRKAYFTWFPHLVPAVSVRSGDWKLIRRFQPHPDYPETQELYNLKEDIAETQNLVNVHPQIASDLESRIDQFIRETGALVPQPNPAFQADTKNTDTKNIIGRDPAAGLVPKFCETELEAAALKVRGTGRTPFLGTAQLREAGPFTCLLEIRAPLGGPVKVTWKTADQVTFPDAGQNVEFVLPAVEDWQNIKLELPIKQPPQLVRLYLPASQQAVEIQSITVLKGEKLIKSWNFASPPK